MRLYLIDGNSYVYRAFYAIKNLSNSKGFPTNAIYGFTNMLLKIVREKKPDGLVVSFDSAAPTERHKLFEEYKAHRPKPPDDLILQFPHIRKVVAALQVPLFEVPGYEADDLLATLAVRAARDGAEVYIVTADKDMLQVVDERIKVYDPAKDRILDEAYVRERFGVPPRRIPEYMALTGDASDNIPGIKGIGEKTAAELLAGTDDLEEILTRPELIKREKLRKLVADHSADARMSRVLATVDRDALIDVDISSFRLREPDWPALQTLFSEYEFGSLLRMIPSAGRALEHAVLFSTEEIGRFADTIEGDFALAAEASALNPSAAALVGLSLCGETGRAAYVPLGHIYPAAPAQASSGSALQTLSRLFEDSNRGKIGHNLKIALEVLRNNGAAIRGRLYDTMIASWLLNPNRSNHSLEEVGFEHLSFRKKSLQEFLGHRASFAEVPVDDAAAFAAENASLAFELKEILFSRIEEQGLGRVYREIEMPLITVLADMERAGFKVDTAKLDDLAKELGRDLESIEKRIYFLAGEEFNINSPKQLGQVLFHSLGLRPGKKTKTGFSTDVGVLEELATSHELPQEILNYRSLAKLKSTYADVLPRLADPKTGRIHTSFNQTATATGRLSSSDPNLQNIPVRSEWGRRIREAFVADTGNVLVSADYSQIELRILAHLSGDQALVEAFTADADVHTKTAAILFSVHPGKVTTEMRRVAKTVNFGVIYGISPFGLSEALKIPRDEARQYIEGYFRVHSGVKLYIERLLEETRKQGFATTMFGRRRAVPELLSKNPSTRSLGERLAVNSPIQGTAADLIKIAMTAIAKRLDSGRHRAKMILQVHDELVFEVPRGEAEAVSAMVKEEMEGVLELAVPLKVEVGQGVNWAEAHG